MRYRALMSERDLERRLDVLDQMIADGRITPGRGSLADLPLPEPLSPGDKPLSVTLIEMRDEERW